MAILIDECSITLGTSLPLVIEQKKTHPTFSKVWALSASVARKRRFSGMDKHDGVKEL